MKYTDYVRENVATPAGMINLRVDEASAIIPNRAQGYFRSESGELRNSAYVDNSNKIPAGGFSSTVEDLARFAIAVTTARLLKPDTLKRCGPYRKRKTEIQRPAV